MKKPQLRPSEAKKPKRQPNGKFKKGSSGNPGGVPKWDVAIREKLRTCTEEGVAYVLRVIRGEKFEMEVEGTVIQMAPTHEHRLRAVELAMRFTLSPPKQDVELTGKDGESLVIEVKTYREGNDAGSEGHRGAGTASGAKGEDGEA